MAARARASSAARHPLHVLREYAVLADGERAALVGPRGDIVWMCAPGWDSDAVFSTLIGGAGVYALTPEAEPFVWGGYYEEGSLIWHSRWTTRDGVIEAHEALAYPGRPGTAVLLRRLAPLDCQARVRVVLDPHAGFDRFGLSRLSRKGDAWTARCGPLRLRWTGAEQARRRADGALELLLTVPAGAHHDLVLELSDEQLDRALPDSDQLWSATRAAWRQAVPSVHGSLADGDARHSFAVLRGMTSHTGGMVAGATTSLPEHAEQSRNYDYRYVWVRDQCYVGQAVAAAGPHPLLDDAVRFITERLLADGAALKPAYTFTGAMVPDERMLDLGGYPGGSDKLGNRVRSQFQLDAFGECLLLLAAAARHDRLDSEHWRAAETAVAAIEQRWREPDAGIWELHDARWAHSRLCCVAGLRAIAGYAPATQAARWSVLADRILTDASTDCLHPSGRWRRAPDDDGLDAALLLPAVRGALPAKDPRSLETLDAVLADLGRDFFMYRYRPDGRPLGEAEGAFLLCGFLTALALHQQGRDVEAARWFERNRSACGPPGIYTEEMDVRQRQLRGNLPQAFVHGMLIECANRLAEPWPH